MSINRSVFIEASELLIKQGFQIIPCYHGQPNQDFKALNKTHSILPKGWNNYNNNPHRISSSADLTGLNYDSMISAMVLVTPGYVVLDLDRKDEEQALLADKVLTDLKPYLPKTLVVRTASGGYHFYYKTPRKINASRFAGCIDIQQENLRGKNAGKAGKGVWAPGCVRDGVGEYTIAIDAPIVEIPESTIELLEEKFDGDDATAFVGADDLDPIDLWPDRIGIGDRNNALYKIAGSYYGRGIPKEVTKKIMAAIVRDSVNNDDGEITDDTVDSMVERTYSEDNDIPDRSTDMVRYCLDRFIHEKSNNRVIDLVDRTVHKYFNATKVFSNFLYEVEIGGKTKLLNAIEVWVKHPKKRVVMYVGYKPRDGLVFVCPRSGTEMYNIYQAPALEDDPGDKDENVWKSFEWLCGHLVPEFPEYLLNYAAYMVQKPDKKLSVATVIFSEYRGVGKNLFFDILSNLVGRHNSIAGNINDFLGQFNYQLSTAHNILVDEAEHRPTPNQMARFKSLITEDFVKIEQKGIDSYIIPAYFNFLVFANKTDNFPVEVNDRRFNMFVCPNKSIPIDKMRILTRLGTNKMNLKEGLNLQGIRQLYDRLSEYEIDEEMFSGHSRAIDTSTKQFVRESSLPEIVQNLLHDLKQKIGAFTGDIVTKPLIKAHCAKYYNTDLSDDDLKHFILNSGHITKLPYESHPEQPRMIGVPQFYIDRLMYLRSEIKKQVYGYICRNYDHYPPDIDMKVIKQEYMRGYDAVTSIGGDSTVPLAIDPMELSNKVH